MALGISLLGVAVATSLVYEFSLVVARSAGANLIGPFIVYVGVFVYMVVRRGLPPLYALFPLVLGLIGFLFFGVGTMLLVACSYGDCL